MNRRSALLAIPTLASGLLGTPKVSACWWKRPRRGLCGPSYQSPGAGAFLYNDISQMKDFTWVGDRLPAGQGLLPNHYLRPANNQIFTPFLIHQGWDGDLRIYDVNISAQTQGTLWSNCIWQSYTANVGVNTVFMQTDGNFVLVHDYGGGRIGPIKDTGTENNPGAHLLFMSDRFQIRQEQGVPRAIVLFDSTVNQLHNSR